MLKCIRVLYADISTSETVELGECTMRISCGYYADLVICQYFSKVLDALKQQNLQLLCDINTQWSTTLLMVWCIRKIRKILKRLKAPLMTLKLFLREI